MPIDNHNCADIDLSALCRLMATAGANHLLCKTLSPNDNPKNQLYLSGSMDIANILPMGDMYIDVTSKGNRSVKASFPMYWLNEAGDCSQANQAKLILYPQYPEVRLSGFLRGSDFAPSALMNKRESGRLLIFGITSDRRVIAWATHANSRIAHEMHSLTHLEEIGVFKKIPIRSNINSRNEMLKALHGIHKSGWINSKSLDQNGNKVPYQAQNGVGYTLEAELGVARNAHAEPDFLGWEVKAGDFGKLHWPTLSKAMTLMTPNPTGGFYKDQGPTGFIQKFGYADTRGVPDRLNFGGVYRIDERNSRTGLTLCINGYDIIRSKIENIEGSVALVDDNDIVAAEWSFISLLNLWKRKHAQAVFVPAEKMADKTVAYRYSNRVRIGEGTNFHRLLNAIMGGRVYVDPAMKLLNASKPSETDLKSRSQFRVRYGDLPALYDNFTELTVFPSKH